MNILNAMKGQSGEFEVNRSIGWIGGIVYIFAAPILVFTGVINHVTLTEFCLAYPAGVATIVGGTAGAVALKDRSVATSKVIADTGAAPGVAAPAGPLPVAVVNPPSAPIPVAPTE